mgnify:CR=1 FL=1|tara:strand:+ start:63 stop:464 length:402 start_codon:yes stop_codon:yes gene_type:complete
MEEARKRYIAIQKSLLRGKTVHTLRKVKEERFRIVDEQQEIKKAYMNDKVINFGMLMTLTTRAKIHIISYKALQDIRDLKVPNITRLPMLVKIHLRQLQKMKTNYMQDNIEFYTELLESIEQNVYWLKILLSY